MLWKFWIAVGMLLFVLQITSAEVYARSSKAAKAIKWDQNYSELNCGSPLECRDVAGQLNLAGKTSAALPYFAKACDGGLVDSCSLVAMYSPSNSAEARKWHKKACDLSPKLQYCFPMIWIDLASGALDSAKALFKQFCPSDESGECDGYILTGNKKSAHNMLKAACDEGHAVSCNILVKAKARGQN